MFWRVTKELKVVLYYIFLKVDSSVHFTTYLYFMRFFQVKSIIKRQLYFSFLMDFSGAEQKSFSKRERQGIDFLCHSFLARVCALEEALFFQLNLLGSFEATINNDRAMVYTVGTCSIKV